MQIGFFEVDDWAFDVIKRRLPNALITPEKLLPENAKKYSGLEIISPFIYSQLNKSTLLQLPHVKFITTRSTGFDHIDLDFCKNKEISKKKRRSKNLQEHAS